MKLGDSGLTRKVRSGRLQHVVIKLRNSQPEFSGMEDEKPWFSISSEFQASLRHQIIRNGPQPPPPTNPDLRGVIRRFK